MSWLLNSVCWRYNCLSSCEMLFSWFDSWFVDIGSGFSGETGFSIGKDLPLPSWSFKGTPSSFVSLDPFGTIYWFDRWLRFLLIHSQFLGIWFVQSWFGFERWLVSWHEDLVLAPCRLDECGIFVLAFCSWEINLRIAFRVDTWIWLCFEHHRLLWCCVPSAFRICVLCPAWISTDRR